VRVVKEGPKKEPKKGIKHSFKKRTYANRLKKMSDVKEVHSILNKMINTVKDGKIVVPKLSKKKRLIRNAIMHPVVRVGKRGTLRYAAKVKAALDNFDKGLKANPEKKIKKGTTRRALFKRWTEQAKCRWENEKKFLPKKDDELFGTDFCAKGSTELDVAGVKDLEGILQRSDLKIETSLPGKQEEKPEKKPKKKPEEKPAVSMRETRSKARQNSMMTRAQKKK
jgi:hypothetical protein